MDLKSQCSAWWKLADKTDKTLMLIHLVGTLILITIGLIQLDLFIELFGITLIFLPTTQSGQTSTPPCGTDLHV
ncbi:hypothetical protein AZH46_00100 [Corynebacterium striatum]|nr:hypothetical protein AZH46_00100 [Corynebacterium striatum]